MRVWAPRSAYRAKQDGDWEAVQAEMHACTSLSELDGWFEDFIRLKARDLPEHWGELICEACESYRAELTALARSNAMDRIVGQIARGQR